MKKIVVTVFFLSFIIHLSGQEFLDSNTMKLNEVSTNKNYGYKSNAKKSIKVGSIENEYKYINALTGPNGEHIYAQRLGSCCAFKSKTAAFGKGYLDQWEIAYEGIDKPIILYLNGYDYDMPRCPFGLGFKKE